MYRDLNHNQLRFIAEYLAVLPRNATEAYLRVYDCGRESAHVLASRLMADPDIRAEIERREEMMRENLALTAEQVLREIALIATADPRELTECYRGACRHCYGLEFKYQRRPSEYAADFETYRKSPAGKVDPLGINFPVLGGLGFSTKKAPNPACPECDGHGEQYEVFKDTRTLSPGAARLYEGVERTKNGLRINTRNRDKALDLAAQHLGISRKAVELTGKGGGPVQTLGASVTLAGVDPTTAAQLYQSLIGGA